MTERIILWFLYSIGLGLLLLLTLGVFLGYKVGQHHPTEVKLTLAECVTKCGGQDKVIGFGETCDCQK